MIQCFAPPAPDLPDRSPWADLRLISASKMDFEFKSLHPRLLHKHESFLEILYVRDGTGVYCVGEERYNVSAGDIIINNANTLHDEEPNNSVNLNIYGITVSGVQLEGLPPNTLVSPDAAPVFSSMEHAENIESMMGMIYTLLVTHPDDSIRTCYYLTMALLSQIGTLAEMHRTSEQVRALSEHELISRKIKNYIDSHYDERFTLEDIGRALYVSPYYLSRIFKKSTGFSPMHYTIRRRLGEAQSLLSETDMSITEIALNTGFGSQCQFYSMFRKYIGMSPGEYRQSYSNHE